MFCAIVDNCICTQANKTFRRYCSLFLCGCQCCPLILCPQHTDAPAARAQNYASPHQVSANAPIMYFVIFLSQAPWPYGFVMVFVKPRCCMQSSLTSFRYTSTVRFATWSRLRSSQFIRYTFAAAHNKAAPYLRQLYYFSRHITKNHAKTAIAATNPHPTTR